MKQNITLNTLKDSTFTLAVNACNGMIHLIANVGGSEYTLIRLPQELKQWPIGSTLCMNRNSGSDFGGMLNAELDCDSAERLASLLSEAATHADDAPDYEDSMSDEEARALLAQLHEEAERDSEVLSGYIPLFDD